jgi:hypothetical protein
MPATGRDPSLDAGPVRIGRQAAKAGHTHLQIDRLIAAVERAPFSVTVET